MLNLDGKGVKSASFGHILLIKWPFVFSGVFYERTKDLLMLARRKVRDEYQQKEEVCRTKVKMAEPTDNKERTIALKRHTTML